MTKITLSAYRKHYIEQLSGVIGHVALRFSPSFKCTELTYMEVHDGLNPSHALIVSWSELIFIRMGRSLAAAWPLARA